VSGEPIRFECLQCGECCRRLVFDRQGVRKGLPLFPDERHVFPEELVKPGLGIGSSPDDEDFEIISYQMTEKVCPHLEDGRCGIWPRRAVMCRSYPFVPVITQGGYVIRECSFDCTALARLAGIQQATKLRFDPESVREELENVEKASEITRRAMENVDEAWFYDLKTDDWLPFREMLR